MTSRSSGAQRGQEVSPDASSPTAAFSRTLRAHSSPARSATVERLGLQPHPEGGWYRRTWTAPVMVDGERPAASAIHFLLMPGERSEWHVVDADELWLWHGPGRLTLLLGDAPGGETGGAELGPENPQVLVPAGTWQATEPAADEVLVSCVVSPGFTWDGFRLG
jgi:predicted cupin superfamily sugar epimerase